MDKLRKKRPEFLRRINLHVMLFWLPRAIGFQELLLFQYTNEIMDTSILQQNLYFADLKAPSREVFEFHVISFNL